MIVNGALAIGLAVQPVSQALALRVDDAATVAEVSVAPDGTPRVHRLVTGIDAGMAVNPDQVKAQMEGGAVYALTAVYYGAITIDKGRTVQSNFHQFHLLRLRQAPAEVDVHFRITDLNPTGRGEPALPPILPAVCNALFAITGERVRELPLSKAGYRWA